MYETAFIEWVHETGINNIIWCTDLDHTVLDMLKNASAVTAPAGLEESFHLLDAKTEGRFYVITGREMSYVDRTFPNGLLKASTEYHNVMRWDNDGIAEELTDKPQWHLIDDRLKDVIARYWPDGLAPRDKPFMRSLHQNSKLFQDPAYKETVRLAIQEILHDYYIQTGQRLDNIDGGSVFDIAPEGSSKGPAMEDIIADCQARFPNRDLKPVYFGDSPGDLPAVPIVKAAGGKFVSIGNDKRVTNVADFKIHTPSACRILFANTARLMPKAPAYSIPDLRVEPITP